MKEKIKNKNVCRNSIYKKYAEGTSNLASHISRHTLTVTSPNKVPIQRENVIGDSSIAENVFLDCRRKKLKVFDTKTIMSVLCGGKTFYATHRCFYYSRLEKRCVV